MLHRNATTSGGFRSIAVCITLAPHNSNVASNHKQLDCYSQFANAKIKENVKSPHYITVAIGLFYIYNINDPLLIQWDIKRLQPGQHRYSDVIMSAMASQITSPTIVYSTVYLGTDERKHQSSASLAFVRGIHRWPVNSPHKGPVTRKMFPFDDVIMNYSPGNQSETHHHLASKHTPNLVWLVCP